MNPIATDIPQADPSVQRIDLLIVDMQGQLRSKWIPVSQRDKVLAGEVRLPISTQVQDIWGEDNDQITGMALSAGDPDGCCVPDVRTLASQPWDSRTEQVLASLHGLNGECSFADPRGILANMLARFKSHGWTPVVAVELEFYLFDDQTRINGIPRPPGILGIAGRPKDSQVYDARCMDRIAPVLTRIQDYATALSIPAEAAIAEFGPGQFEINLRHRNDALLAADEAILFKRVVDRAASEHDLLASFMAKPYTEHGGSGMHVHVSILDEHGNNIFDADEGDEKAQTLLHATAGLLDTLEEAQALLAPHANSYRRLQPESYAPVRIDWGYDHRGVAIRLPETRGPAARLEHRVAGADANPYLALTAILGGILHGLQNKRPPALDPLMPGENSTAEVLSHEWMQAIERMASSPLVAAMVGQEFCQLYTDVKRHEALQIARQVTNIELQTYLPRL